ACRREPRGMACPFREHRATIGSIGGRAPPARGMRACTHEPARRRRDDDDTHGSDNRYRAGAAAPGDRARPGRRGLAARLARPETLLQLHLLPTLARVHPHRGRSHGGPRGHLAALTQQGSLRAALRVLDPALVALRARQPVPAELALSSAARLLTPRLRAALLHRLLDRDAGR